MFGLFKKKEDIIGEELVEALKGFLKKDGIAFFTKLYKQHKTLMIIEKRGPYSHIINFQEGMRVRNFMRTYHNSMGIENWTADEYDERWEEATLRACGLKCGCH